MDRTKGIGHVLNFWCAWVKRKLFLISKIFLITIWFLPLQKIHMNMFQNHMSSHVNTCDYMCDDIHPQLEGVRQTMNHFLNV